MKEQPNAKRTRNGRGRAIRLGLMLLVTGLLWWGYQEKSELQPLIRVSEPTVLTRYASDYAETAANGRTLQSIAFHKEFSGSEGEAFYVVWETAEGAQETEKYHIVASDASPGGYTFVYKTVFENITLPSSQFVFFAPQGEDWVQLAS